MNKFIIKSGATWLSELAVLVIIGLSPIIFNFFYSTNIDLIKLSVFKVFALLLLFAIVWRFSEYRLKIKKNVWHALLPLLILLVFLVFSLLFSVDVRSSWLGSYDRQEGLISWLFYILWAILLVFHLSDEDELNKKNKIKRILIVAAGSGFVVSVYAIFQWFGLDFLSWSEPASLTGRAVSTFGQPNYLACWLLLVLPFSAYLYYLSQKKFIKIIWVIVFVFGLAALFFTGSRAALLVFLLVSVIWYLWFFTKKKKVSFLKICSVSGGALLILFLFLFFLASSNQARFQEFFDFNKGSMAARLDLWQSGLQAIAQKPLFGYGLENQKEVYIKYYKVDWALYANPNTYSDRAHNLILDIMLTSGIVGLAVFVYFFRWIYLNLLYASKNGGNKVLAIFLIWSLSAYLASLLFNFSVTVTNIYFWLIVALSLIISQTELFVLEKNNKNHELSRLVVIFAIFSIFIYGLSLELRKLEADYYYDQSLLAIDDSEYFTALVLKGYMLQTKPDMIHSAFYNEGIALRLIESLPMASDKSSQLAIRQALSNISSAIPDSNFENKFVKAFALGVLGRGFDSETKFKELIVVSPELPKIYLAWGDSLLFNANYPLAKLKLEKALSLLPDVNSPYLSSQQKINLTFYKEQVINRLIKIESLQK